MYLIADLKSVADSLADKNDRVGNVDAEAILSRLRLVQLLDPRVSYRVNSLNEIKRLLDRAKTYLPQLEIATETIQPGFDDDIWAASAQIQSVSAAIDIDTMWILAPMLHQHHVKALLTMPESS